MHCNVLRCVVVRRSVLQYVPAWSSKSHVCLFVCVFVAVFCSVLLQCGAAVCCSVLQCAAVCCSVLQCVAVCCSVLQCVAVCVCTIVGEPFVGVCACERDRDTEKIRERTIAVCEKERVREREKERERTLNLCEIEKSRYAVALVSRVD